MIGATKFQNTIPSLWGGGGWVGPTLQTWIEWLTLGRYQKFGLIKGLQLLVSHHWGWFSKIGD